MSTIASTPGLLRVLVSSVAARLPLPMLGIGLLVHAEHLTDSFAAAGVGLTAPPVGACARALLPGLVEEAETARMAYALDATAVELTFVFGPPLALGLGAATSTGTALAAAGAILLAGTAVFAADPASRQWRPDETQRPRGGSLTAPGIRTLVLALAAVGVVFGAAEVGVAAAAEAMHGTAIAGPLLALWGVGSLIGGVLATRLGGGTDSAAGLAVVLAALAAGHLALAAAAGSLAALALTLLAAGTAIAPAYASVYAMVERLAPAGTVTEAFAWLSTAAALGTAGGAAGAGPLAEATGPVAAFVLAGGAGAVATALTALRTRTLAPRPVVVVLAAV